MEASSKRNSEYTGKSKKRRLVIKNDVNDDVGNVSTEGICFETVEPWKKPVNPAILLTDISKAIRRFVVCPKEIADGVALWIAFTWFIEVVEVAPIALITSPEKRCAKTTLLSFIGELSKRPLQTSNMTPAVMYRTISEWCPTFLIDETDIFMKENSEFKCLLNGGHTRKSAFVIRSDSKTYAPKKFSTWGAKALASIGHVADTIMDRSIIFELKRKLPTERVEKLRYAESDLFEAFRAKLARFAQDFSKQVRVTRPDIPQSLNDRAQDNWEPLLGIAQVAGGKWPKKGAKAAIVLSAGEEPVKTLGVKLLADVNEVFAKKAKSRISTKTLLKALHADEKEVWRGKMIGPRQLADTLRVFGIRSKDIRFSGGRVAKGYERESFTEAISRYVTPPSD